VRKQFSYSKTLFALSAAIAVAAVAAIGGGERQFRPGDHIPGIDRQVTGTELLADT
jgi:hypothetical protein